MTKRRNEQALEVWLDAAHFQQGYCKVGTLFNDRGQIRFVYTDTWLKHPLCFMLDPELTLDAGVFFPDPQKANFGIFLDSCPDRWGQQLMDRRELIQARDEKRPIRTLYAWDYLLGAQDETRIGALRFRLNDNSPFLDNQPLPAPPVTSLQELAQIALELSSKHIDDLNNLRQWLAVLVAPGASLGGAHPKANFRALDGSLWIAKFPSRDDIRDHGAWEKVVHDLAAAAKIWVPSSKLVSFHNHHHTFCVQRFDRTHQQRHFFTSAMTLLGHTEGEFSSYLELAEWIATHGAPAFIEEDLARLFPAYDLNPNLEKAHHVLAIDEVNQDPNLNILLATADFYRLKTTEAAHILEEVSTVVSTWQACAKRLGIANAEIALTAPAFHTHMT